MKLGPMKLGEILHSKEQWLKGTAFDMYRPGTMCLGYALCLRSGQAWGEYDYGRITPWYDARMAAIIKRLFPERYVENIVGRSSLVQFNNHPNTSWEEIQKVIAEYDREVEADAPIL